MVANGSDRVYGETDGEPELYGEANYTTLERLWVRPSLDINGVWSGFTGDGAKTVIPATAHAKLSMRRMVLRFVRCHAPAAISCSLVRRLTVRRPQRPVRPGATVGRPSMRL